MPSSFRHVFSGPVRPRRWAPLLAAVLALAAAGSLALTAVGSPVPPSVGQTARTDRYGLGLDLGMLKLLEGGWDYSTVDRFAEVRLVRGLTPRWSLTAGLRHGQVRCGASEPGQDVGWTTHGGLPFYTVITQAIGHLEYAFSPAARISPFVAAGAGLSHWRVIRHELGSPGWFPSGEAIGGYTLDGDWTGLGGNDVLLEVQVGLDVELNQHLVLNARALYQVTQGNDEDSSGASSVWGPRHVDANRAAGGGFLGVTWWFGSPDGDHDGVPDDRDLCPREREDRDGYNDLDGCPDLDNDRDGVPDGLDDCPDLAEDPDGFADEDGCPELDNDRDGVPDTLDRCPDTPAGQPVDRFGCAQDQDGGGR